MGRRTESKRAEAVAEREQPRPLLLLVHQAIFLRPLAFSRGGDEDHRWRITDQVKQAVGSKANNPEGLPGHLIPQSPNAPTVASSPMKIRKINLEPPPSEFLQTSPFHGAGNRVDTPA